MKRSADEQHAYVMFHYLDPPPDSQRNDRQISQRLKRTPKVERRPQKGSREGNVMKKKIHDEQVGPPGEEEPNLRVTNPSYLHRVLVTVHALGPARIRGAQKGNKSPVPASREERPRLWKEQNVERAINEASIPTAQNIGEVWIVMPDALSMFPQNSMFFFNPSSGSSYCSRTLELGKRARCSALKELAVLFIKMLLIAYVVLTTSSVSICPIQLV